MNSGVEPSNETAGHRLSAHLRSPWTLPVALALIAAIYTAVFHFRAPYFDHWDLVPLMMKADAGTLDWQTLFRSHGSHWHASGYAVMLTNSTVFNQLHGLDSAASVIAMTLGFPALARILNRVATEEPSATTQFVLYAIGAFFYFSLDQAINLVWGWQCALFFSTSASLWAIEAFSRDRLSAGGFVFGTTCIGFALTGFATAWALFPVCAGLILFHPQASRPRRTFMLAGLCLALLLLLAGHFASNPQSHVESRTPTALSVETLFGLGHYAVNYIGQGIFRLRPVAPLIGLFGIACLAGLAWVSRGRWQARRALWAMAAFGYGTALLTALGRWQTFGPDQAFANRYATLANFTWIGVAALVYLERDRLTRAMPMAYPALLALAISFGAAKGVNSIVGARNVAMLAHTVNGAAEDIALTWPETSDETLNALGEHTSTMKDQLQYLCEKQRSVFIDRAGPEGCRQVSVEYARQQGSPNSMSTPESRLKSLGIDLPEPMKAVANYVPFVITGNQLFVSGQVSVGPDGLVKGRLGENMNLEVGQAAARLCGINLIAQCKAAVGDLSKISRVVKLGGFVNAAPSFEQLPQVVNGCSDLMVEVFGDAGRHARSAVSCPVLPLGVAVEVDGVFEIG